MKSTQSSLVGPRLDLRLAAYAAAGVALASPAVAPSAKAALVDSGTINISIPSTTDGVYINFVTGATSTAAALAGYDFNPYNDSAGLTFYGAASPSGILATGDTGGSLAVAQHLTGGESVSATPATGFYNQFQTVGSLFQNTGVAYVGIKFLNEAAGVYDYGWAQITTTAGSGANLGFPAAITRYAYDNTGLGVTVPNVPEPGTTAALGFGALSLGAAGVRRWRKARQAVA